MGIQPAIVLAADAASFADQRGAFGEQRQPGRHWPGRSHLVQIEHDVVRTVTRTVWDTSGNARVAGEMG